MLQYVELQEEELESKERLIAVEAARISQFYSLLTSSIDVIFKFCDKIPGYNDLCKEDRELLFRSACLDHIDIVRGSAAPMVKVDRCYLGGLSG